MSLLALLAAHASVALIPVTPTGPEWTDNAATGGGSWTTPTQTGVTYSPASGTATPGQVVTVTATASVGYVLTGYPAGGWPHTFPAAPPAGPYVPPPYSPPADTTPYAFPTGPTYMVPQPVIIPTYDGSGQNVHPSVVDFQTQHGYSNWHGYRYWMGVTPYPNTAEHLENPSVYASHDGYTWHLPAGLTNPIEWGGGTGPTDDHNSDTELVYDYDNDRLVLFWRRSTDGRATERIRAAWSTDGSNWTIVGDMLVETSPDNSNATRILSPSVEKVGSQWVMLTNSVQGGYQNKVWTAPDPLGPWTDSGVWTRTGGVTNGGGIWHFGMVRHNGVLYGLNDTQHGGIICGTSATGATWVFQSLPEGGEPLPNVPTGPWDAYKYRADLTPHENGTHMRVWYSARTGAGVWNTGYTLLPLSLFPTPPA